ncbi:fluoride efflux transporter FluC [Compostimonas suwonensis]|uniref:Fluoride-specific ion channel FluC n=1 Tax=Compostimonas suwonensis TaxID=1048394 RepID=A0A2M9C3L3_9MICO|nr:CrcB family protein [Compostimonas suwonensis]PJJ65069.1 CrcB protein [Compostimonas suwonensis]
MRPVHLRWSSIGLVALGGAFGTAAREALSLSIPAIGGVPVAIFGINIVGAFLLGVLLEALVRRGPDEGRRRGIRLLLGTGVLGGFTTYSALATDTAVLLHDGQPFAAIGYSLATIVIGALATALGIVVGSAIQRMPRQHGSQSASDS